MNEQEYGQLVGKTDQAKTLDVALYGIARELGSVSSAVRRGLIGNDGKKWNEPNNEIVEELGDLLWYCFAFARCYCAAKGNSPLNILTHDITNLQEEIGSHDQRGRRIGDVLNPEDRAAFLERAAEIPSRESGMELDEYQEVAFLTARTEGRVLLEVCLAVLTQLCAELYRVKLPEIEITLNQNVADRRVEAVLGEMVWHIAAITSLYGLKLGYVAEKNNTKVSRRYIPGEPTALYDELFPESERFSRQMEVCFVSVADGLLQMYYEGKRLGDPLTDNAPVDDGYRYHDILHFAFVAKLGWSPVLRDLLRRKRKSDPKVDVEQDGARARIVEEAVLNAFHAEGERQATLRPRSESTSQKRLFATRTEISFDLLRLVENFVRRLEVRESQYWEWENAIFEGFEILYQLREEHQGTIRVDLDERTISFRPTFHVGLRGRVVASGSAADDGKSTGAVSRETLIKRAILNALGIKTPLAEDLAAIEIDEDVETETAVKPRGRVRKAMWEQGIVEFRIAVSEESGQPVFCEAAGIGDAS